MPSSKADRKVSFPACRDPSAGRSRPAHEQLADVGSWTLGGPALAQLHPERELIFQVRTPPRHADFVNHLAQDRQERQSCAVVAGHPLQLHRHIARL